MFRALTICISLIASAATSQTVRHEITHDGERRFYELIPSEKTGPQPLVLVLHGAGGDARSMRYQTNGTLARRAEARGWHLAYPEALDGMWDTDGGRLSEQLSRRSDDGGYLGAVIDDISRRHGLDTARVFATGFSRGAQASFLAACKLSGRIRAVAPVAMAMPVHLKTDCVAGPPVGVMMITGTEDPFVPVPTGPVIVNGYERDTMLSPADTAAHWRQRNGCENAAARSRFIDAVPDDGTVLHRTDWPDCPVPVINMRIDGGGHVWPTTRRKSLFRSRNREVDAAEAAFAFFESFK